jgi:hypothetical protein
MLGAGFVTRPTLDVLSDAGVAVTVGKNRRTASNSRA